MSGEPKYRYNKTRPISVDLHENPKIMARLLIDGKESVYLECYIGNGKRKTRTLKGLFLYPNPKSSGQIAHNREVMKIARTERNKEEIEFLENSEGYKLRKPKENDFLEFCDNYVENYNKAGIKNLQLALRRFRSFLSETPSYRCYKDAVKAKFITPDMIKDFVDYLKSHGRGSGPSSAYSRFKSLVNAAVAKGIFTESPCKGITLCTDENQILKDVLSVDEIKKLLETHYKNEATETHRAFQFCLFTGIRGCDVRKLTYGNVDYPNKVLRFVQNKTKWSGSSSTVILPLTDAILEIIGPAKGKNELIFKLPGERACLDTLQRWVKNAGIDKHITWHCARHSFAINHLINGTSVVVVSKLLGHSSLHHTMKYLKAVDKMMQNAMDSYSILLEEK